MGLGASSAGREEEGRHMGQETGTRGREGEEEEGGGGPGLPSRPPAPHSPPPGLGRGRSQWDLLAS